MSGVCEKNRVSIFWPNLPPVARKLHLVVGGVPPFTPLLNVGGLYDDPAKRKTLFFSQAGRAPRDEHINIELGVEGGNLNVDSKYRIMCAWFSTQNETLFFSQTPDRLHGVISPEEGICVHRYTHTDAYALCGLIRLQGIISPEKGICIHRYTRADAYAPRRMCTVSHV